MTKKITLLLILTTVTLIAQSVYEPVYNKDIYSFLENLANKNVIELFIDIRPVTRQQIAEKLIQIEEQSDKLTSVEKERLEFYKKEYAFELMYIGGSTREITEFFSSNETGRFNLFKYYSDKFTLTFDPVIGIGYNISKKNYHQYGGIQFSGRIRANWSFYFNYRDNTETGTQLDRKKYFSPITGNNILTNKKSLIDYSETRGGISYGWEWGNFTAAKDFINIGSSNQGSIIFSDKAPSIPYIRLEVFPVSWFRYNFIHGWLNSNLIDSSTIRYTGVTSTVLNRSLSYSRLFKYYVGHSFSFQPLNNLWFTFGESIIYGDRLEFVYFLPVFYRLADHYNSVGGGDTGDNAQLFFNASYIWSEIHSKIYTTLYIDEFSPSDIFSGGDNAQVFAFTLGGNFANPLWKDNYINIEYNAIRPYVGMNADPLHTYESSGYPLGHWIGSNAVQIYAEIEQYFPYMINAKTFFNYVIKGEKENINDYYNRLTSTYPLLFGKNSYYSEFGIKFSYNPVNDLFFELSYSYISIANGRFKDEFKLQEGNSLMYFMRFGFK